MAQDKSRKCAEEAAANVRQAAEMAEAFAKVAARIVEQTSSSPLENMRELNASLIEMAQTNTETVFDFARQMAAAKTPSDMVKLWTRHARRQFEMLNEQVKELRVHGEKIAGSSAEQPSQSLNERGDESGLPFLTREGNRI